MEEKLVASVVINCDGYYPECGNCGYWLKITDKICPECNRIIDWRGLIESEKDE